MDQAPNQYLHNAVMTATPEQLHLMLYDGAIRFTRQGIDGINGKNWEQVFNGLSRAQKIVLELLNSLNHDVDKELCSRMAGLYNFIYRRLVEAGTSRDAAAAAEALRLLEYQRETWVMLIDKVREQQADEASPSDASEDEVTLSPAARAAGTGTSNGALSVQG